MIVDISDGLSELTAEELLLVAAGGNLAGAILCGLRGVVFGGIGEALVGAYAGGPIGLSGVGGMITAGIGGAGAGWFNK
ncbi:ABC transporter permease [Burkholderia gladioli]|uniref:ABC transporter permease n=1 Tax=Burkholderia gladioli TaxID=28095 RepID=UPI000FDC72BA|nr:ABC transporter permease [Burkholderia gladioli]MBJ9660946.1 ABC transporter permease [Burkholderia gladioli]MBU9214645.1 ABC transporter permease [Burkholderia gladioli]MDC6130434.1 ABC transporter permease [Burkholderia gladioli]MDN7722784.1 ABC transporter permease [Burkholderia gladioli]MDN7801041.1 ABC transporter permease [Burkholderia gladioli]